MGKVTFCREINKELDKEHILNRSKNTINIESTVQTIAPVVCTVNSNSNTLTTQVKTADPCTGSKNCICHYLHLQTYKYTVVL